MMSRRTFLNIGIRYWLRHPWQSFLMVLGITLGVAVVIAVDLANASASRAFDLSAEAVAGKTTHQVRGGPQGLDERVYTRLRRQGLPIPIAPLISEYVASAQLGGQPLQLLGVDPFAEAPFRSYLGQPAAGGAAGPQAPAGLNLVDFLTRPEAVMISEDLAQRYNLSAGQSITLEVSGRLQPVWIAGLLQADDELTRRALEGIILADISAVQELTGREGRLDSIDMILPEGSAATTIEEQIRSVLPAEARLEAVEARSGTVQQMIGAFRVNLTALSLLALVVGMFLIYNTITFSVVQRRPLFGTLRCLGVTRKEIFGVIVFEGLLVGLVGSAAGLMLGLLLGQGAVRLVTQTINDLFFVVTVRGVQIPWLSLAKGALLGVGATLLTAAPPAWEAASVPPRAALSRSGLESKAHLAITLAAFGGMALAGAGLAILYLPSRSLTLSFIGTFAIVVGAAMLAPLLTRWMMHAATPVMGSLGGALGRMAPRNVVGALSRTAIAVMALMVAVSVTIGVSLMVSSFRGTVVTWLGETLQGDIYISAPGLTATTPSTPIDPQVVDRLRQRDDIERIDVLRSVQVSSPQGMVQIAATDNPKVGMERIYYAQELPKEQIWPRLLEGAVIVSEPFANRLELPARDAVITLDTPSGAQAFPVVGIYYDYASTQGTVLMALPVYQRLWEDRTITAIAVHLKPGGDVDQVQRALQDDLLPLQRLAVRANQALRQEVLVVFDRTFAITGALQILATIVAFIGILSALLSLELERQRELGILRSMGLTVRQLWRLILMETGLMGAAAGVLAAPTGYILALILVYIINRRSFGWTLQMQVDPAPFLQAFLVAVGAALIAGLYPAWRMGKMITSEALRSE